MESFLLENYAKKRSDEKEIAYIQPVTMLDTSARFQMPTPIKASSVKNGIDTLAYAGKSGGGIDILARVGSGRSTTLAVMELKDENKDSEPPRKVICQRSRMQRFCGSCCAARPARAGGASSVSAAACPKSSRSKRLS